MTAVVDRETASRLLAHITAARWFAGKGRRADLVGLTPLPWVTAAGSWPAVRFEVAEVGYPDEGAAAAADGDPGADVPTELYQLALSYRRGPEPGLQHAEVGRFDDPDLGPVVVYDAMQDPQACRVVMELLLEPGSHGDDRGRVGFHLVADQPLRGQRDAGGLTPRVFTGQQSNTSVMYGDVAMLKLFRRLEVGRNLDIEVHRSLSRSGVADVAALYGWVEADWPAGGADGRTLTADLAMVVQKLADAEDGWALALDTLGTGDDFAERAGDLGRALAEIHAALREQFPTGRVEGARVARVMRDRLLAAAAVAPALEPHVDGLLRRFEALAGTDLDVQRVHGDFHLGQTLHTPTGWKIIDFEGEPVKSLTERAEPDSVWRDVAGMLRSFAYAAASVPGADSQEWARRCREAFLQQYAGAALSASDEALLDAYVADKAVYEVVYEVRSRPDWVGIPLAAVAGLAAAPARSPGPHSSPGPRSSPEPAQTGASSTSAAADQAKE